MAGWQNDKPSGKTVFWALMLISIVCLLIPQRITNKCDSLFARIFAPLSRNSRNLSVAVIDVWHKSRPANDLQTRYRRLEMLYQQDRNRLVNITQELRYQRRINEQLAGLRQQFVMERASASFVVATVAGSDSMNQREIKLLDQGRRAGVAQGQLVIGSLPQLDKNKTIDWYQMAVVGKIGAVPGEYSSQVQLLSDPGFDMKVLIQPNPHRQEDWQVRGILKGRGMGRIQVEVFSSIRAPIKPGDVVLTRGQLPVPMIVGLVRSCDYDEKNPVAWDITMKPAVDLHLLQQVIIVRDWRR